MKLIFIHGRGQDKKDPIALQAEWESAWQEGLVAAELVRPPNVEIRFPYYGDRLAELTAEIDAPLVDDVATKGAQQDTAEADFRGALIAELAVGAGISDADIQQFVTPGVTDKAPQNWKWVQGILRALDNTRLGTFSIDAFTRDVYVYLTNRTVRKEINRIVSEAIPDEPCVVVGHSLGTVVGYNVLYQSILPRAVNRYVTLGSPLGVKAIQRHIEKPTRIPSVVSSWHNAYDDRDVVALRSLSQESFPGSPPLLNKADVKNKTENRHGIVGYLNDPVIASWICQAL